MNLTNLYSRLQFTAILFVLADSGGHIPFIDHVEGTGGF